MNDKGCQMCVGVYIHLLNAYHRQRVVKGCERCIQTDLLTADEK